MNKETRQLEILLLLVVCVGVLVALCPLCCASSLSKRIGEHCCVPCFVPGGIITLRTKVRLMLGIRVSRTHSFSAATCILGV